MAGVRRETCLNLYSDLLRSTSVESSPFGEACETNIERLPPKPIQYAGGVGWEGGSKGGWRAGEGRSGRIEGRTGALRLTG